MQKERGPPLLCVLAVFLFLATPALAAPITLKSGFNGTTFVVQGQPGTAGTLGVDYALGTYIAGGNGLRGHGFGNTYGFHTHLMGAAENGFVSTPAGGFTAAGMLEDVDHNWFQGTTRAIIVDLGFANTHDQAIVFNSIDHTGSSAFNNDPDPQVRLWNALIEGIEFTVYGSNDLADALAAAALPGVFGATEAGFVPGAGTGSSFEQGTLAFVFEDGWKDFGNANEGDDFASVWTFSQAYQYIAVYSNNTDPFVGDGFRSFDNELDAIGRFLTPVDDLIPEPTSVALAALGALGLALRGRRKT